MLTSDRLQVSHIIPANLTRMELETLDLGQADSMPLLCRSVSMLDHFLVIVFMYYTASLFIYLFCRKPNPDVPHTSEMTLRVHSLLRITRPGVQQCQAQGLVLSSPSPKPCLPRTNPNPKPKKVKNRKSYGTVGDTIITWAIFLTMKECSRGKVLKGNKSQYDPPYPSQSSVGPGGQ